VFENSFFFWLLFFLDFLLARSKLFFRSCRYQPPLPADQVKPLNEYEEEGGELIVFSLVFQKVKNCDHYGCQ
jgi:hypothetical protein